MVCIRVVDIMDGDVQIGVRAVMPRLILQQTVMLQGASDVCSVIGESLGGKEQQAKSKTT
jgi:predicted transcriptional regulator